MRHKIIICRRLIKYKFDFFNLFAKYENLKFHRNIEISFFANSAKVYRILEIQFAHLVDLETSENMRIYLQRSGLIQPRTRLPKFGMPACPFPPRSNKQLGMYMMTPMDHMSQSSVYFPLTSDS